MNDTQCSVEGCDRTGKIIRGMCGLHYKRFLITGTTDPRPSAPVRVCSADGCERVVLARGMCSKHYQQIHPQPTGQCSVEGCDHIGRTRYGMCVMHYRRVRDHGSTDLRVIVRPSPAERFAAALTRMPNGCLEWTGKTVDYGYGSIWVVDRSVPTHRFAWTLANGPIPEGLFVCHRCDNPPCCQTDPTPGFPEGHLFLGTSADNQHDMVAKSRHGQMIKTHCKHGHEFTEANTYIHRGHRVCRTCGRENARKYRSRT